LKLKLRLLTEYDSSSRDGRVAKVIIFSFVSMFFLIRNRIYVPLRGRIFATASGDHPVSCPVIHRPTIMKTNEPSGSIKD